MIKFIKKIIKLFAGKSSVEMPVEEMPEVSEIPEVPVQVSSKKALWKFIIQTLINILAAILTALGASAAVVH